MKAGDDLTEYLSELISLLLFCIGLYGLAARRNIIKSIISLGVLELAVILFFLSIGGDSSQRPPIAGTVAESAGIVDPLPQALMITAIVIGISVTAVTLTLFITMYHHFGTTNWDKASALNRGERHHD